MVYGGGARLKARLGLSATVSQHRSQSVCAILACYRL